MEIRRSSGEDHPQGNPASAQRPGEIPGPSDALERGGYFRNESHGANRPTKDAFPTIPAVQEAEKKVESVENPEVTLPHEA